MPRQPSDHENSSPKLGRRDFLTLGGAAMAGAALAAMPIVPGNRVLAADELGKARPARKRSLRIAHFTDVHVQPEKGADAGLAAALKHAQSLSDPPQVIFTGGDAVMDVLAADAARARTQWDLWRRVLQNECSLPLEHCIGNHDVWGWNKVGSKTSGREPGWGKQQALDEFGIASRYRGVDHGGWHFIFLDSIFPDAKNVYIGRLDDEQFAWLQAELKKVPAETPIALVSHIPILSVAIVEFRDELARQPKLADGALHTDGQRIVKLLKKHPNVKLALSGHLHLTERIDYAGVTYLCAGAVCGAWWRGANHGTREGYLLVDLYDDGSVENQYVAYGWKPRE